MDIFITGVELFSLYVENMDNDLMTIDQAQETIGDKNFKVTLNFNCVKDLTGYGKGKRSSL